MEELDFISFFCVSTNNVTGINAVIVDEQVVIVSTLGSICDSPILLYVLEILLS